VKGIVRNKPLLGENYFEVEYQDVIDFIEGDKNPAMYYVEKDQEQSKFSLKLKKTNIEVNLLDDRLYKIPKKESGEIIITNNIKEKKLTVEIEENFRNYLKKKYNINGMESLQHVDVQGNQFLDFVLAHDNDPHNLILHQRIPLLRLLVEEKVDAVYETNYNKQCVFTKRIYNEYAYKEVQ
jgi:rRNA maturation protein Rpf1